MLHGRRHTMSILLPSSKLFEISNRVYGRRLLLGRIIKLATRAYFADLLGKCGGSLIVIDESCWSLYSNWVDLIVRVLFSFAGALMVCACANFWIKHFRHHSTPDNIRAEELYGSQVGSAADTQAPTHTHQRAHCICVHPISFSLFLIPLALCKSLLFCCNVYFMDSSVQKTVPALEFMQIYSAAGYLRFWTGWCNCIAQRYYVCIV